MKNNENINSSLHYDDLDDMISMLKDVISNLRKLGILAFLSTSTGFIMALFFISTMPKPSEYHNHFQQSMFMTLIVITVIISFFVIIFYDFQRRKGDALFEEISDEFQWNLNNVIKNENSITRQEKPKLKLRFILREYTTTIDLPLVRGKIGTTYYASINILSILITVSIFLMSKQ